MDTMIEIGKSEEVFYLGCQDNVTPTLDPSADIFDHRNIESGLEGTSGEHQVQPPLLKQVPYSRLLWKVSMGTQRKSCPNSRGYNTKEENDSGIQFDEAFFFPRTQM